ncbi:unnamed protein product [Rhizophagus irregularis]|uniref:Uncharacterized protein n=1 Tax=Rhizophagus irregularis TaxID=588596 RepID=A0A2N1MJZ8_9GLOM|nr:hypothetical protein RhiirC2_791087 [Rhizophagus irregularis]CAB4380721.1 unnamed protein product [Rhizophagus irregularis]
MTKRDNQRTGNTEVVESPTLDMNFDFADAPPAIVNKPNNNEESDNEKENEKPKKSSIRKVNHPRSIKKEPAKVEKVEQPILSKRMKRMKDNLRIDMVGYEQKNYVTRSYPKKRRK